MVRKTFIIAAMAGLMLVYGAPVRAAEGWYISANAGVSMLMDSAVNSAIPGNVGPSIGQTFTAIGDVDYDYGPSITGALGYAWKNTRLEGELSYRKNDLANFNGIVYSSFGTKFPQDDEPLDGDVSALALMANGYYDFSTNSKWRPYVMAGIGGARLNLNQTYDTAAMKETYDTSDYVFAYQVGAGIGY